MNELTRVVIPLPTDWIIQRTLLWIAPQARELRRAPMLHTWLVVRHVMNLFSYCNHPPNELLVLCWSTYEASILTRGKCFKALKNEKLEASAGHGIDTSIGMVIMKSYRNAEHGHRDKHSTDLQLAFFES